MQLGKNKQVDCTDSEYYKFLGYVSNHPNDISVVFERNELSGAWGSEGRIQFRSNQASTYFPTGFKFTAGLNSGNILYRLNCNHLIENMVQLGFVFGNQQNSQAIRANIPSQYQNDFDIGANLP